jgi:hypothetical protein
MSSDSIQKLYLDFFAAGYIALMALLFVILLGASIGLTGMILYEIYKGIRWVVSGGWHTKKPQ